MTIYAVIGQCGEYSDHRLWPVVGFKSKEVAEHFVIDATIEARDAKAKFQQFDDNGNYEAAQALTSVRDPDARNKCCDWWDEISYFIWEMEVE